MKFTSDDAITVHQIMKWRRDVRHFRPDPVAPALIDKLAASMEMAPSVGNCRPWRVIRVEDPHRRGQIANLFAQSNAAAAAAYPDADRDAYLGLKLAGLYEAPEHLAIFSEPDPAEGCGLGRQTMRETVVFSTVMAMYTLWLTARAENLGIGWV
jgi:5,6-dimethylbenzimidazole synthase